MRHLIPKTRTFDVPGGLVLRADAWGQPGGPVALLSHGGGQTRHSWGGTGRALSARGWYAVSYDHRGHGDSDWAADGDYRFATCGADMAAVARTFDRPPAAIGASLGGIAALLALKQDPQLFSALVLVDITPRIEPRGVDRILDFMTAHMEKGFASPEDAAKAIADYLPQRQRRGNINGLEKNLRRGEDGRYRWHWDPRFVAGKRPEEVGEALVETLSESVRSLALPTLLVRGRMSDVVSMDNVRHFLDLAPHARFADVSAAGHMVAGDHNGAFTDAVLDFLDGVRGGTAPTGAGAQ